MFKKNIINFNKKLDKMKWSSINYRINYKMHKENLL